MAYKSKVRLTISILIALLVFGFLTNPPAAQETPDKERSAKTTQSDEQSLKAAACSQAVELLQQQKALLSRELGQLKREMALLRESIAKPGLKEIFGGIGYILGLAGIGFFVHCRKTSQKS